MFSRFMQCVRVQHRVWTKKMDRAEHCAIRVENRGGRGKIKVVGTVRAAPFVLTSTVH